MLPPDPTPLRTYIDLWVVRNGQNWVDISEDMLIDAEGTIGRMTRALAKANLLDQHYMTETMTFKAKIKEGV